MADVRFGSKADIGARPIEVRFTPESGHWNSIEECPVCAKSRHPALQAMAGCSATSFAHRYQINTICCRGNFLRCTSSQNTLEASRFFRMCREGNKRMTRSGKGFELERRRCQPDQA
jgi:hypothetical protein